jgi:hypothetical protein
VEGWIAVPVAVIGTPVGFAKVGWNDLTRPLVVNEARALERLAARDRGAREFDVPHLIHAGPWRDLELLVVEPVSFGARRRFSPRLPLGATDEVASLGDSRRCALGDSEFWRSTVARIRATAPAGDARGRARLEEPARLIQERHGDAELEFVPWHGDWVPWNMGRRRGRLHVWDWERSGGRAPRGLDGIHFDYQAELGLRHAPPVPALDATLRRAQDVLPVLGVDAAHASLLLAVHLLEMALRFDEARQAGVDTADPKYLPALRALLAMPRDDRGTSA